MAEIERGQALIAQQLASRERGAAPDRLDRSRETLDATLVASSTPSGPEPLTGTLAVAALAGVVAVGLGLRLRMIA